MLSSATGKITLYAGRLSRPFAVNFRPYGKARWHFDQDMILAFSPAAKEEGGTPSTLPDSGANGWMGLPTRGYTPTITTAGGKPSCLVDDSSFPRIDFT